MTAACQASLSFTMSQSLLKLMSIEWCHPTYLILCRSLLLLPSIFHSIRSLPVSRLFTSGSQSIGASASASVLPMNIHGWFPLGLTGFISLLSKGLSGVFTTTTVWKHQFFSTQPSLWSNSHICYMTTGKIIALTIQIFGCCLAFHSFSSKEQASFNFMAAVTIWSDFGAPQNKVSHCFHFSPSICHKVIGPDATNVEF